MTTPTAAPPPAATAATPAKKGGCLKGCLSGCLVLVVLAILVAAGGWYGWKKWGHPWLERKKHAVEAKLSPAGLGFGSGKGFSLPSSLTPKLPARAGHTTRSAMAKDLWVPKAAGLAAYDTQPDGTSVSVVRVNGKTVLQLVAEARKGMRGHGWKLVHAGKDGKAGTALDFERPGAVARIGLYPRAGAVEVWSRRRATGSGSRPGSGAPPAP